MQFQAFGSWSLKQTNSAAWPTMLLLTRCGSCVPVSSWTPLPPCQPGCKDAACGEWRANRPIAIVRQQPKLSAPAHARRNHRPIGNRERTFTIVCRRQIISRRSRQRGRQRRRLAQLRCHSPRCGFAVGIGLAPFFDALGCVGGKAELALSSSGVAAKLTLDRLAAGSIGLLSSDVAGKPTALHRQSLEHRQVHRTLEATAQLSHQG